MNSVQLVGRLTRDPDIRYSDSGKTVAKFTLAVDRRIKKNNEEGADFISCVAFDQRAEFLEKWFRKGQRIGLNGRIQTGSYTNKEGQKVYTTDVIADSLEFVESKGSSSVPAGAGHGPVNNNYVDNDGFMNIPDDVEDEGLPFN